MQRFQNDQHIVPHFFLRLNQRNPRIGFQIFEFKPLPIYKQRPYEKRQIRHLLKSGFTYIDLIAYREIHNVRHFKGENGSVKVFRFERIASAHRKVLRHSRRNQHAILRQTNSHTVYIFEVEAFLPFVHYHKIRVLHLTVFPV